jgi:1-acyl-sn-glycerol-3-phosphate acyltransferase
MGGDGSIRRVRGELNAWWRIGLPLVAPLLRLLFRVRVDGEERVPRAGAAILAFNHVSVLDGPILAIETARRTRREVRFLVTARVFRTPVIGWILRRYEQIPIRRGQGDASALDEAITTVREGALAALAPEGRVNDDGVETMQRIRSGVARIALPSGAPVIPVGIWGTQKRWPRSGVRLRQPWPPRLALAFGNAIDAEGDVGNPDDVARFLDRVRSGIEDQVVRARELA